MIIVPLAFYLYLRLKFKKKIWDVIARRDLPLFVPQDASRLIGFEEYRTYEKLKVFPDDAGLFRFTPGWIEFEGGKIRARLKLEDIQMDLKRSGETQIRGVAIKVAFPDCTWAIVLSRNMRKLERDIAKAIGLDTEITEENEAIAKEVDPACVNTPLVYSTEIWRSSWRRWGDLVIILMSPIWILIAGTLLFEVAKANGWLGNYKTAWTLLIYGCLLLLLYSMIAKHNRLPRGEWRMDDYGVTFKSLKMQMTCFGWNDVVRIRWASNPIILEDYAKRQIEFNAKYLGAIAYEELRTRIANVLGSQFDLETHEVPRTRNQKIFHIICISVIGITFFGLEMLFGYWEKLGLMGSLAVIAVVALFISPFYLWKMKQDVKYSLLNPEWRIRKSCR